MLNGAEPELSALSWSPSVSTACSTTQPHSLLVSTSCCTGWQQQPAMLQDFLFHTHKQLGPHYTTAKKHSLKAWTQSKKHGLKAWAQSKKRGWKAWLASKKHTNAFLSSPQVVQIPACPPPPTGQSTFHSPPSGQPRFFFSPQVSLASVWLVPCSKVSGQCTVCVTCVAE